MKNKFYFHITVIVMVFISVSCSSPPKNKGDVFVLRSHAEEGLALGNREAGRGNYENARRIIAESKRNALLTDDTSLITRSCLSLGNVLIEMGRTDEAFIEWNQAVNEAQKSGNSELLAVSMVFRAKGELVSKRATAQDVLSEIERQQPFIKTDNLNIAFSWQAKGLALRELRRFSEAEDAMKRSLEIHEKGLYLENASYDWYTIASIRSVSGDSRGALDALQSSIAIDRRIENSWGLAASYRAMGVVYRNMGNNLESQEAFLKALEIYKAMGNEDEVAETERRMNN